jgi:5-methylcytosine-specific restriction endonuclease McrA
MSIEFPGGASEYMALTTTYSKMKVAKFEQLYHRGSLELAPAFQRNSVWSESDRRLLVKSVFESIPLPSVYLYKSKPESGRTVYSVIDGKQRIETLLRFLGEGPLARRSDPLDVLHSFDEVPGGEFWWRWRDLYPRMQQRFLATEIPVIIVEGEIGDIIDLFVRINSTGKKLSRQERRHARWGTSDFLQIAQRLADDMRKYFTKSGVLAHSQIERMQHVELVIELMLAVHQNMPLNKKGKIDEIIQTGGMDKQSARTAAADVKRSMNVVNAILPNIRATRFRRLADYYTLVLLVHSLHSDGVSMSGKNTKRNKRAGTMLEVFGASVDEVNERLNKGRPVKSGEFVYRDYLMTVKEGTDSKTQRLRRERILRELLEGIFVPLDSNLAFNATQRRILWQSSSTKNCHHCHKTLNTFAEVTIDHVVPYARGGRTRLDNAVLSCRRCNSAKGART